MLFLYVCLIYLALPLQIFFKSYSPASSDNKKFGNINNIVFQFSLSNVPEEAKIFIIRNTHNNKLMN